MPSCSFKKKVTEIIFDLKNFQKLVTKEIEKLHVFVRGMFFYYHMFLNCSM